MTNSRAYIDTYYLLEVMFAGKTKKIVERLLSHIDNNNYDVFIPQIVLGEAISQMDEKCNSRIELYKMFEKFARFLNKYDFILSPLSTDAFPILSKLLLIDDRLTGTDAIILSHALADPNSTFLFTPDNMLVKNRDISDYEQRLRYTHKRNTKLQITYLL